MPHRRSFTLLELIITTVILAILVGLAIPNYLKSVGKTVESTAITNLQTIRASIRVYLANTGSPLIPDWADLDAINTALGLSIIDTSGVEYKCDGNLAGQENNCSAHEPTADWWLHFHENFTHNLDYSIHCMGGNPCPSCPVQPGNCG